MAKTINGVDFSKVIKEAISSAKKVATQDWKEVRDIVKNIADGLAKDVEFLAKKKASGEFNQKDAGVFMDDQKMLARIRLRSVAIIGLQMAERIWNAIADVFRKAIKSALGWTVLLPSS
jgi:hypothetical protein